MDSQRLLGRAAPGVMLVLSITPAIAQDGTSPFDHLQCFKVTADRGVKGPVDILPRQTAFPVARDCRITGPVLLCVPVSKTNVRVKPPSPAALTGPEEGDHLCYKLKC